MAAGDTVDTSSVQLPVNVDEALVGWTTDVDGTEPEESIKATAANMTLYPVIKPACWITYHANGGSVVEPDYVIVGDVTVVPAAPQREGYTFAGWYTDEDLTEEFRFGSELESNIDLYAKWTPKTVPYQVVYWLENADDDGYTYYSSQSMEGLAGTAATYPTRINVPEHFMLNKDKTDSETVLIDGDGTSIKNVYFARNTYTITFTTGEVKLICGTDEHKHGLWKDCYDYWGNLICGKEEHEHTDDCYEYEGVSATRKYDADIKDLWELDFVKEYSEAGYLWKSSKTENYYSFLEKMPGYDVTLTTFKSGNTRKTWDYYLEALDGKAPAGQETITNGGRTYYKFRTTVVYGKSSLYLTYEEDYYGITGFTQRDKDVPDFDRKNYAQLFYLRNDYDISFVENGGPDVTDQKDVLYERDISSYAPQNYTIGETTKVVNGQTWYFTGWYENEACAGQPYSFVGKTMPAHNLLLYAGWSTKTFSVTFDPNGGTLAEGTEAYTDVHYGATVEEPDEPTLEGYLFAGWTKDNKPFSFTTPITEDTVLKAAWVPKGQGFEVIYDAGDGSGKEPVDPNRYAPEAQAEVLAPGNGLVAPEGKVFLGWMTDDGVVYQPGDLILIGRADVTLIAKWGPKPAMTKVIYHLEGGDYDAHGENAKWGTYGDENYVSAEVEVYVNDKIQAWSAPTRDGYEFLYWQRGDGKTVVAGGTIQVDADNEDANILTAVWKPRNADLTITKKVDVLGAEGQSKEPTGNPSFTIHVEVNDAAYNGTYTVDGGEPQTATNGNIALTDGQTATISLPIGSAYTVTEVAGSEPGYIYFDGEENGTIAESGNTVTITNKFFESVTGTVTVNKTWAVEALPSGASVSANLTLTGKVGDTVVETTTATVTYPATTHPFTNLPTYYLDNGEVKQITYTVSETGIVYNGKTIGTVTNGNQYVVYTNVAAEDQSGPYDYEVVGHFTKAESGLTVTNTWKNAKNDNGTYGFQIKKVDAEDPDQLIKSSITTFTVKGDGFKQDYTDSNADGIIEVTDLQPGTYKVTEATPPTGYNGVNTEWTITISETGKTLKKVEYSSNVFTNFWNWVMGLTGGNQEDWNEGVLTVKNTRQKANLTVTKTVEGDWTPDSGYSVKIDVYAKSDVEQTNSLYNNTLSGSPWSCTFENVPTGDYVVVETVTGGPSGEYYTSDEAGEVEVNVTPDGGNAILTNTYTRKTGTLVIEKKIPAEDWSAVPSDYSGTIHYAGGQTGSEKTGSVTFGKNDFETKNDYYVKTWRIEKVPTGSYTVTENENTANITDYARTISYFNGSDASKQVTVSANGTATVTVTNDYEIEKGDLTLEKDISYNTVRSNEPTDKTFTFTVTIDSLPHGTVGTETYTAAEGTYTAEFGAQYKKYVFTLTGNDPAKDTAIITDMPVGTRYTVTEDLTGKTGYTSSLLTGGAQDTMVKAGKKLTVTNTYFDSKTIDLEVTKDWGTTPAEYRYTVTVALYEGNEPVDGVAPVTLNAANNWTATFEDLDLYASADSQAYNYSVVEKTVNGDEADNGRFILYNEDVKATDPTSVSLYEVIGFWTSTAAKTSSETGKEVWTVTNTWKEAADDGVATSLTVLKLEEGTNNKLNGVSFKLTGKDYESTLITGDDTKHFEDGQVIFSGLTQGKYSLTETVPDGYTAASGTNTWEITVGANGSAHNLIKVTKDTGKENVFTNIWNWIVGVTGGNNLDEDNVLTVYNTKKTGVAYDVPDTITITKVDSENEKSKLPGAKFELYKDGKKVNTTDLVTKGNGELPLTFGSTGITQSEAEVTYTLKEVTPPAGYKMPDDEWTITVKATTEEVKEQQNGEWVFVQRTTYDATIEGDTNDSDAKTIENEKVTAAVYGDDTITINKKDQYGAAVEGAVFALYAQDGTTPVKANISTGANGKIELKFSNESGDINPATDPKNAATTTYVLEELRAPTGFAYVDPKTAQWDVTVTVTPEEKLQEVEGVQKWVTTYTYDATIEGDDNKDDVIDVENTRNNYTVTVKKIVTGETDALPDNFQITNSYNDTSFTVTESKGTGTASDPYTWTMKVPYDTEIVFTEEYYTASGYTSTHTVSVNGAQAVASNTGTITVSANSNTVTFTNDYQKDFNDDQNIVNTPAFYLLKTDGTNPLPGAKFELYDSDGKKVWETTSTDQTIEVTIEKQHLGTTHGQNENEDFTFTLKEVEAPKGYTKDGTEWTVSVDHDGEVKVEKSQDGTFFYKIYTWIVDTITGTGASYDTGRKTLTVTNTRDLGTLTISKKVTGIGAEDTNAQATISNMEYTFDIQAENSIVKDVAGETFSGVLFGNSGKATVEVKNGETKTLTNLPTGSYTVTERTEGISIDHYKAPTVTINGKSDSDTVELEKGGTAEFKVINDYEKDTGSSQATLTIRKEIKGTLNGGEAYALNADTTKTYYFRITGTNVYGETVNEVYQVTVDANSSSGEAKFTLTYSKGNYTITEVADQTGTALTEENVACIADYTWDGVDFTGSDTFAFGEDGAEITATNTYTRDTNDLSISKTVSGGPSNVSSKLYKFTITANNVAAVNGTYNVTGNYDADGTAAKTVTFTGGEATVRMKAGETLTIEGLPTGSYTVTENADSAKIDADQTDWTWTVDGQAKQAVIGTSDASLSFTNTYTRNTGTLVIAKEIIDSKSDGNPAEASTKTYTFTLTGPADVMNYGENGTYKSGTVVFTLDEGGLTASATITITGEGSKTIPGLPTGTYTVTEDRTSADVEYWELAVTGEGSVDVTNNGTAEITVTNTYTREVPPVNPPEDQLTTLTITKMVKDSRGGDLTALAAGKNYYFQITGEDVYGDAPLTENVTVTGAGSVDVDLIWGDYEVTEVDANGKPIDADSAAVIDGYQWTKVEYTGNTGIKLDKETTEATVTVTNTYAPGAMDIPVVKTWSGDYSSLPNNIEVALYADGADTGLRLTLDSSDRMDATHWLGVFESTDEHPLYRYADGGKEIVYSVVETEMNGNSITGSSIGYWDITTGRTTAGVAGLTGYDDDATVLTVRNDYDLPDDDDDDDDDPTPSPSTEPTPSPSTEPTPSPSPSDEVEVPDEDTPLDDLPDEIPEDEVDIPDEDTPLSDQPDETDIFEEGVPMGDLPQTGSVGDYTAVDPAHTLGMLALAASLMAAGLLVLIGRRKDEETDQD